MGPLTRDSTTAYGYIVLTNGNLTRVEFTGGGKTVQGLVQAVNGDVSILRCFEGVSMFSGHVIASGTIGEIDLGGGTVDALYAGPTGPSDTIDTNEVPSFEASYINSFKARTVHARIKATGVASTLAQSINNVRITGSFSGSLEASRVDNNYEVTGQNAIEIASISQSSPRFAISKRQISIANTALAPIKVSSTIPSGTELYFNALDRELDIAGNLEAGASIIINKELAANGHIKLPAQGLQGQIVINASNSISNPSTNAWLGKVSVGTTVLEPSAADPLYTAPYYGIPSMAVGGGAVGVVPFRLYEADCLPPHKVRQTNPPSLDSTSNFVSSGAFATSNDNSAVPVQIRYYGPVTLSGAGNLVECTPESVVQVCGATWQPATTAFTVRAPGTSGLNARSVGLSRLPHPYPGSTDPYPTVAQGVYRAKYPVKCVVAGLTNPPSAAGWDVCSDYTDPEFPVVDKSYYFRVVDGVVNPNNCIANYNGDAIVSVQDIFDFLSAWFAGCSGPTTEIINGVTTYVPPCWKGADVNHSTAVNVQDIFDFLAAWFSGC